MATTHHSGFSAVELLLTLFIAAAFLITGYQLYVIVVDGAGEAQRRSSASELATLYLKRYAAKGAIPTICPATTTNAYPRSAPDSSDMPNNLPDSTEVQVQYSCPDSAPAAVTKVEATVWYGDASNENHIVKHVIYAIK